MIGALVPSTSMVIGEPLTVITTVALPSSRGKSFIPGIFSLLVSDGVVASVVNCPLPSVAFEVAVEVGDVLEATFAAEHPPNIRPPIINRATKNCENFNRIASY
ncbi:hypothetical protein DSM107003_15400 [Trichormus variabilis SAG 1403-4b]|uniref:Uncharacterized protein n=1 Tax=Trichormus variabilis SAG 1403-4b TaxID=447716 RepID=A0A433UUY5_ANAVA|nr:hypothetical protein DSM107003_15400 [Trichormus variabilis SAG 1403-4b]